MSPDIGGGSVKGKANIHSGIDYGTTSIRVNSRAEVGFRPFLILGSPAMIIVLIYQGQSPTGWLHKKIVCDLQIF